MMSMYFTEFLPNYARYFNQFYWVFQRNPVTQFYFTELFFWSFNQVLLLSPVSGKTGLPSIPVTVLTVVTWL